MGVAVYIAGIPVALSYNVLSDFTIIGMPILDGLDNIASNYMLPIGGMLTSVYVGYALKKEIARQQIVDSDKLVKVFNVWFFLIRFVTPVTIFIVFLNKIGLFG